MKTQKTVPAFGLYGEGQLFPEVLHVERIFDRAHGHAWNIHPHRHPHLHQFLLIHTGAAEARVDAETTQIPAGHALGLPPWTVHGFHFQPHTEGLVISLSVSEFPALFDNGSVSHRLRHWQRIATTPALGAASKALYACFHDTQFARRQFLESHGTLVGLQFAAACGGLDIPHSGTPADSLMLRFEALVRRRFRERLKLADYASELAVSAPHLSRSCRAMTGTSASRFIESVVFREACNMLAYSRLPVAQIGYDLGFQDAAYFSRAFRKHTGMPPGEYRKAVAGVGKIGQTALAASQTPHLVNSEPP